MPICDGVEAARRIRALEVERGYDIVLPSKYTAFNIIRYSHPGPPLSSNCLERRLPRIYETIVFKLGNGRLPFEACKQGPAFKLAPAARASTSTGHGHPCKDADIPLMERLRISKNYSADMI